MSTEQDDGTLRKFVQGAVGCATLLALTLGAVYACGSLLTVSGGATTRTRCRRSTSPWNRPRVTWRILCEMRRPSS